jgi:DNA-binding IscR family transcriptional regulator
MSAVDEDFMVRKCGGSNERTCLPESVKCLAHNLWDKLEDHIGQ